MTTLKDISYLSYIGKTGGTQIDKRTHEGKFIIKQIKSLDDQQNIPAYAWEYIFSQNLLMRFKDYDLFFNPCQN